MWLLATASIIPPIYGCLLDASKASDRVNHSILFDKLLQRNLSPIITRTLLNWYSDQRMCVSWNSKKSDEFPVSNGIRQGGVLLPIFLLFILMTFCLSLKDRVLVALGCYWNKHFVGAVCYADDIMSSLCWHPHPLLFD